MARLSFFLVFLILFSVGPAYACEPLEKAEIALNRPNELVDKPVAGLYASIPSGPVQVGNLEIRGDSFTLARPGQPSLLGKAIRNVDPYRKNILFDEANLEGAPSFIDVEGTVPLIPARGTPLLLFMTLQQFKAKGVPYGALKTATSSSITNVQTCLELRQDPRIRQWIHDKPGQTIPGQLIADVFLNTKTGKYMQTALTQSGHRIVTIKVTGAIAAPTVAALKEKDWADARYAGLLLDNDPNSHQVRKLDGNDFVPYGFKVEMQLAPLPH